MWRLSCALAFSPPTVIGCCNVRRCTPVHRQEPMRNPCPRLPGVKNSVWARFAPVKSTQAARCGLLLYGVAQSRSRRWGDRTAGSVPFFVPVQPAACFLPPNAGAFLFLTSEHLLCKFSISLRNRRLSFRDRSVSRFPAKVLFLSSCEWVRVKGHRAQCLPICSPGLLGLYIAGNLVLLIRIPLGIPKQRADWMGWLTDLRSAHIKTQDTVSLRRRHSGEDIVGDIAAAVHYHEGAIFAAHPSAPVPVSAHRAGRYTRSRPFHAEDGEKAVLLQVTRLCLMRASVTWVATRILTQRMLTVKLRRRTDAGSSMGADRIHKAKNRFSSGWQGASQSLLPTVLPLPGRALNGKNAAIRLLLRLDILSHRLTVKMPFFLKVQHHCTRFLRCFGCDAFLRSLGLWFQGIAICSVGVQGGGNLSCASINLEVLAGVPR